MAKKKTRNTLAYKSISNKRAYRLKVGVFVLVQYSDSPKLRWGILLSPFERETRCADVFFSTRTADQRRDNIGIDQVVGVSLRTAHAMWEGSEESQIPESGLVEFPDFELASIDRLPVERPV